MPLTQSQNIFALPRARPTQCITPEWLAPPPTRLDLRLPLESPRDDDWLLALCQANRALRIERSSQGDLVIMSPTGAETGARNANLLLDFGLWARSDGRGQVFDSSTGFLLPNGAMRSPDLAWVLRERLVELNARQKRQFLPLAPDVVIELASQSDTTDALRAKMREWRDNGVQLGWIILPEQRQVWQYPAHSEPVSLQNPSNLSYPDLLPGLELPLSDIWEPW